VFLFFIAGCWTFNPQTDFVQRTWFPSPPPGFEAESTDLPTPAFDDPHGFTRHDELMAFLRERADAHPGVATLTAIGESQRGRVIPMMRITGSDPQIRVFLQGGLHGDEPAGSEGLLLLVDRLLGDPGLAGLRDQLDVAVVPIANPDGYERQLRDAANGRDLNRDQTKLEVAETLVLERAFDAFDPAVAVDFHEYRSYRRDFLWLGENGITNPYDVMFLYSGNLNVPAALRELTAERFVGAARDEMDRRGLRHHDYVTTRDVHGDIWFNQGSVQSRSSATNWALSHTVSLLVEIRGVALGRDAFERRVMTAYWIAERVLRTAVEDADRVHGVLAETVGQPRTVAVKQRPAIVEGSLDAIDLANHRLIDLEVTLRDNLQSEATLTRERPVAYAVLPGASELLRKLDVLGFEMVAVTDAVAAEVERYDVTAVRREPFRYEGQRQQHVQVDVVESSEIPAGSTLVRLDRPGSNLALELFEPESPNSFVSFGVVRARPDTSLPFVRVMGGVDDLLNLPLP